MMNNDRTTDGWIFYIDEYQIKTYCHGYKIQIIHSIDAF